jgi:hypothetical protein
MLFIRRGERFSSENPPPITSKGEITRDVPVAEQEACIQESVWGVALGGRPGCLSMPR